MAKSKKSAKGSSKKSSGKGSKEVLIVGSKMKDAIRSSGCNVAGDAIEFLNARVHEMVQNAVARAQENGRKTVRGYDF